MTRPSVALGVVGALALALAVGAGAEEAWSVTVGARTGQLQLGAAHEGRVTGVLLDAPVEGFLVGRSVVLLRPVGGELELWQAMLDDGGTTLVGTVVLPSGSLMTFSAVRPGPSQAGEEGAAAAAWPAPINPQEAPSIERDAPPGQPSELAGSSSAAAGELAGTWSTRSGVVEIRDDGRFLVLTFEDGRTAEGRWTSSQGFIVGLYQGCCRGELTEDGSISWSDGSLWRRP